MSGALATTPAAGGASPPASPPPPKAPPPAPTAPPVASGGTGTFDPMDVFRRVQAEKGAARDEAGAALEAARMAEAKMLEAAPPPQPTSPAQVWGSVAMAVAALGGLLTRTPIITSANAMAGVLNAYKQGDMQKAQGQYQQWKAAHDAAKSMVDLELKAYEDAMKRAGTSGADLRAEMLAQTAAFKQDYANQLLREGKTDDAMAVLTGLRRAAKKMDHAAGEFEGVHARQVAIGQVADGRIAEQEKQLGRKLTQAERAQIFLDTAGEEDAKTAGMKPGAQKAADTDTLARQAFVDSYGRDPTENPEDQAKMAALRTKARQDAATGTPGLTGAALDKQAEYYHDTKIIPSLYRDTADRLAIINREAELYPEGGKGQFAHVSGMKADAAALTMVTKQKESAEAYERSAGNELDLAVSLIPHTPEPLNMQLLTRWARTGETQFGDVHVPQFQAALISGLTEYAKVLSGGTGSVAASSDSARQEALSLIPPGATSEQIPAIVGVLKQGMKFKLSSYDQQVRDIKARMSGETPADEKAAGGASAPPKAAADYLIAHPDLRADFDAKFGAGAAAKVLGGQ